MSNELISQASEDSIVGCKVINSKVSMDVKNIPCFPLTSLSQIVLAEPTLDVCVYADIKLECPAIELKRVRKDAYIDQERCKLLPTCYPNIFKLFVSGFIRKNIEYATIDKCTPQAICGDIRHTTVHVPFSVCTEIEFPEGAPKPIITSVSESFSEFSLGGQGPRLDAKLLNNAACYHSQPAFILMCVCFREYDIGTNIQQSPEPCSEPTFDVVSEYINMSLRLRIVQFQTVPLPELPTNDTLSCGDYFVPGSPY